MAENVDVVHERLKAFLLYLKPFLLGGAIDQDRLSQLRRLSDVRIRKFAIDRPRITGLDLCGLLSDPRSGRFDDLADQTGLLAKAHLAAVLPTLGEDMGYLTEACLTLQVAGLAALKEQALGFVKRQGPLAAPAGAPAARPPSAALPPGVLKVLGSIKDLFAVPSSTLKAITLLGAADSPADGVCAELERDPALAALVLKFVNASSPSKAASIKKAVLALGYPALRRVVTTAALTTKLGPPHAEAGFDERAYWRRAFTIAHAASAASKAARVGNPDEHFSAGLLHGIGRLASAKAGIAGPAGAVGAALLERWRFPATVVDAARHHEAGAERLEELQIPREAVVVAALNLPDAGAASGFLRVPAAPLLDAAAKAAEASVNELLG
ncbi:MAG TPA: HDOD domain-containing protein [Planctomycetota bacterium]|jgi:HD-like signal output (HDOD) protein|nr:HDOD domain-containing protein [Planctomycetota bacterium]